MRGRNLVIAVGALVVLGLGGFGTIRFLTVQSAQSTSLIAAKPATCKDTYRLLKLAPSQVAAAMSVCLVQSLVVTGELHGSVAEAYTIQSDGVGPTTMCSVPKRWDNFPQPTLAFVIGSKAYRLTLSPSGSSERQPATFPAAGKVALSAIADPNVSWNQATGSFALAADGVSGAIDANFLRDVSGARPVHIAGQWRCGSPAVIPSFDSTVPCANFYALNHLQDGDVARMKSGACNSQDLTFAGDVVGHVGSAVTDTSGPKRSYFGADNVCGTRSGDFTATVKFSLSDESFLLELSASNYAGIGPGQFSASSSGSSIGVVLFLGSADPDQQGLFLVDNTVFWTARGGTFTIGNDLKSGTVDADLQSSVNGSTVHVSGGWRCAA
jgi:hypothetical protein